MGQVLLKYRVMPEGIEVDLAQLEKNVAEKLSATGVARQRDIEFLKWLGVRVPADAEARLLEPQSVAGRLAASHRLNEELARALLVAAERDGTPAPGFCLEHVMMGNIEAAIELVERVRSITKEFGGLKATAGPLAKVW